MCTSKTSRLTVEERNLKCHASWVEPATGRDKDGYRSSAHQEVLMLFVTSV